MSTGNLSFKDDYSQRKKRMSSMFGNKMINIVSKEQIAAIDSISGSEVAVEEKDLSIIRGF